MTDGWLRLLSVPVPVPLTRSFTDLPFLLAAALAALLGLCALGRHPGAALAPAVAGFGGLLVLGADGPVTGTVLTGGFALAAVGFLAVAAPPARGTVRSRGVTGMLTGGALIAAAVLVVGVLHPGGAVQPAREGPASGGHPGHAGSHGTAVVAAPDTGRARPYRPHVRRAARRAA